MVIPRLERQSDMNYDLFFLTNPHHDDLVKSLSDKIDIKIIHKDVPISPDHNYNRNSGESNSVEPFGFNLDYEIQTRLDSDDVPSFDFIETIHENVNGKEKLTLLAFKPMRFNLFDLRLYEIHPRDGAYRKSQVLSLFNPKKDMFIYERGHRAWSAMINKLGGDIEIIPFGKVFITCHWDNASGKPQPTDKLI